MRKKEKISIKRMKRKRRISSKRKKRMGNKRKIRRVSRKRGKNRR